MHVDMFLRVEKIDEKPLYNSYFVWGYHVMARKA
jgi:hypothetical protein